MVERQMELTIENDVISIENSPHLFLQQKSVGQQQYAYFTGEKVLSESAITNFQQNISNNQRLCDATNTPYFHIVFPGKIPTFKDLFATAGVTVRSIFSNKHQAEKVVYLLNEGIGEQHFLEHDTHINDLGRLACVDKVLQLFELDKLNYTPEFQMSTYTGDLGQRLGIKESTYNKFLRFKGVQNKVKNYHINNSLPGNTGHIFYTVNNFAAIPKRLLLFGDSFLVGCIRTLSMYFREVIYFRNPYVMEDVLRWLSPDYVLTSNAERYLVNVPSISSSPPYFASYVSNKFATSHISADTQAAFEMLFKTKKGAEFEKWLMSLDERQ